VKRIYFLLFAITMYFIVSHAQGAEWLSIGKDRVGNELFYDTDNLAKLPTGISKVWMKGIYSVEGRKERIQERIRGKLTVENYEKLSYVLELQEINCVKREFRVIAYTDYSSDGGILHKFTVEQQSSGGWEPITPDSMGEIVDKIICPPPTSQKKK
jgi:hypothetical protein